MTQKKREFTKGIRLRPDTEALDNLDGELKVDSADNKIKTTLGGAAKEVITNDQTQTLENKTIDADNNTISNLETDNLKSGVLVTDVSTATSDTELPSALAVKTALEAQNEASEITYDNSTSGLIATDVKAAIDEVENRVQTNEGDISTIQGSLPTGNVVGDTDTQTLTNKTIDGDNNIIQDIGLSSLKTDGANTNTFLQRDGSGDVISTKSVPSGDVVGSSDTQTLTNKTLTTPIVNEITTSTDTDLNLNPNGTGAVITDNLSLDGNTIASNDTNGDINLSPNGTGSVVVDTNLNVDNINIDGNTISSTDTNGNINLSPDGTGNVVINNINIQTSTIQSTSGDLILDASGNDVNIATSAVIDNELTVVSGSDNTSGSNVTLSTPSNSKIRLTNASLNSIDMIPAGNSGQIIYLINNTGSSITLNNETGATAANQIKTGTGSNYTFNNGNAIQLIYSDGESKWHIVNGADTGSGGGTTIKIAIVEDRKTGNTSGGNSSGGSWNTRDLNTIQGNNTFVSLSSNQFTLDAGTYYFDWHSCFGNVSRANTRIRNITDSSTVSVGGHTKHDSGAQPANIGKGYTTIASSKTFELQYYVSSSVTDGLGERQNEGEDEIFSAVTITQIS